MKALMMLWKAASENDRMAFLRELAIPFPANTPLETAQQALLNLNDLEWQELYDWLGENHWLPPGL